MSNDTDTKEQRQAAPWKATRSRKRPDWFVVIGPYDARFIDDLKRSIRGYERRWDDALRAWLVHEDSIATLHEVIDRQLDAREREAAGS